MTNFDLLKLALDGMVLIIFGALARFIVSKLGQMVTRTEFNETVKMLEYKIDHLSHTLDKITTVKVKEED